MHSDGVLTGQRSAQLPAAHFTAYNDCAELDNVGNLLCSYCEEEDV